MYRINIFIFLFCCQTFFLQAQQLNVSAFDYHRGSAFGTSSHYSKSQSGKIKSSVGKVFNGFTQSIYTQPGLNGSAEYTKAVDFGIQYFDPISLSKYPVISQRIRTTTGTEFKNITMSKPITYSYGSFDYVILSSHVFDYVLGEIGDPKLHILLYNSSTRQLHKYFEYDLNYNANNVFFSSFLLNDVELKGNKICFIGKGSLQSPGNTSGMCLGIVNLNVNQEPSSVSCLPFNNVHFDALQLVGSDIYGVGIRKVNGVASIDVSKLVFNDNAIEISQLPSVNISSSIFTSTLVSNLMSNSLIDTSSGSNNILSIYTIKNRRVSNSVIPNAIEIFDYDVNSSITTPVIARRYFRSNSDIILEAVDVIIETGGTTADYSAKENILFKDVLNSESAIFRTNMLMNGLEMIGLENSPKIFNSNYYFDYECRKNLSCLFDISDKIITNGVVKNSSSSTTGPNLFYNSVLHLNTSCSNLYNRRALSYSISNYQKINPIQGDKPKLNGWANLSNLPLSTVNKPYIYFQNNFCNSSVLPKKSQDDFKSNILLFPNPANTSINLDGLEGNEVLEIYNILGQNVISHKLNNTTLNLDISNLSNGTYVCKIIKVNGDYEVIKFIKK